MDTVQKLIRKLNIYESLLHELAKPGGGTNVSSVFIINSKVDFYNDKSIIEVAIDKWKEIHPLLKYCIIEDAMNTFYFAYSLSSKSLNNVEYFEEDNVVDSHDDDDDGYWKYLFQQSLNSHIEYNKCLWNIKIVKLNKNKFDISTNKYCVLFNCHHAITDFRNTYAIIVELFEIIEKTYFHNLDVICLYEDQSIVEENYFLNLISNMQENNENLEDDLELIVLPSGLKQNGSENVVVKENDENKSFRRSLTLETNSKSLHSDFEILCLNEETTSSLIDKCKYYNVELVVFFDLIISDSLNRILEFHSNNDSIKVAIKNFLSFNKRPFLDPPVNYRVMGALTTGVITDFDYNLYDERNNFCSEKFWQIGKDKSNTINEFLRNKTFLNKETIQTNDRFYLKMLNHLNNNTCNRVDDILETCSIVSHDELDSGDDTYSSKKKIHVDQFYIGCSHSKYFNFQSAIFSIAVIKNKINVTVSYNRSQISSRNTQIWLKYMKEAISMVAS